MDRGEIDVGGMEHGGTSMNCGGPRSSDDDVGIIEKIELFEVFLGGMERGWVDRDRAV